ncbi:MAG: MucR family transcriptional regulator [Caulobacteraceae bacterium]|nr:MucR family transcriptional regulator [Caulobacteraceae bacterium]
MPNELVELTAQIAASYVENNLIAVGDLPDLIGSIHRALGAAGQPESPAALAAAKPTAAQIRKSLQGDYIVCFEDGRRMKSLKRHLMTKYGLTPDAYRAKWGLPKDYPMVAPNYAAARSALARSMGLGMARTPTAPPAPAEAS